MFKMYLHNLYILCILYNNLDYDCDSLFALFLQAPTTWWRHQMQPFFALLAICAGNSPVPGEFPTQRPVTRCFDVYFDMRPNKRLSKQSWGWWFETLSHPFWRHRNESCWDNTGVDMSLWLSTQCVIKLLIVVFCFLLICFHLFWNVHLISIIVLFGYMRFGGQTCTFCYQCCGCHSTGSEMWPFKQV